MSNVFCPKTSCDSLDSGKFTHSRHLAEIGKKFVKINPEFITLPIQAQLQQKIPPINQSLNQSIAVNQKAGRKRTRKTFSYFQLFLSPTTNKPNVKTEPLSALHTTNYPDNIFHPKNPSYKYPSIQVFTYIHIHAHVQPTTTKHLFTFLQGKK